MKIRYVLLVGLFLGGATALVRGRHAADPPTPVESFCPGGPKADPNVVMCEDFEDAAAQTRWDITSRGGIWPASDFVQCTKDAFGFRGRCAAWSNELGFDWGWGFWGYSARRPFKPQPELYIRWYQYISDPFTWGTLEDKSILVHDKSHTIIAYVGTSRNHLPVERNSGPGMPFVANYQDVDWKEAGGQYSKVNRFQNQGTNITLQPGKWYLFEWNIKVNTPGRADGVARLWVDDATQPIGSPTLRLQHTDMRWLKDSDAGKEFEVLQLTVYHQRCDGSPNTCPPNGPALLHQSQRWDNIVVSSAPIGPM